MDHLLADEQWEYDGSGHETLWALGDHLGTVRDLIDSGGTIRKHTAYDTFGNRMDEQYWDSSGNAVPAADPSAVDTLFGFTGRPLDESTGLQNNLNRWYDSKAGKWISEDPIGFGGRDANLARYVGNRAVDAADPDGRQRVVAPPIRYYSLALGRFVSTDDSSLSDEERSILVPEANTSMSGFAAPWGGAAYGLLGRLASWCKASLGLGDDVVRVASAPATEAASENVVRFRRMRIANRYLREGRFFEGGEWRALSRNQRKEILSGIDFSKDVTVKTIKPGTDLIQYVNKGRGIGRWFGTPGTPASKLGIYCRGRELTHFRTVLPTEVLESRAKPVIDWWSVDGFSVPTEGGGAQLYIFQKYKVFPR